jgi:hypothetical protein
MTVTACGKHDSNAIKRQPSYNHVSLREAKDLYVVCAQRRGHSSHKIST